MLHPLDNKRPLRRASRQGGRGIRPSTFSKPSRLLCLITEKIFLEQVELIRLVAPGVRSQEMSDARIDGRGSTSTYSNRPRTIEPSPLYTLNV